MNNEQHRAANIDIFVFLLTVFGAINVIHYVIICTGQRYEGVLSNVDSATSMTL